MANYNRFGSTAVQLVAMFPGTAAADLGGNTEIETVLDRIAREVAGALSPLAYGVLAEEAALEMVEDYASAGQTSVTLGLVPVITGTARLWSLPQDTNDKPKKGYGQLTVSAVNLTTGVVTLSSALSAGDRVFATYDLDCESASFSWPSVADAVLYGAAAVMGARLYTAGDGQEWALVNDYRAKYAGRVGGTVGEDGVLRLSREGRWQPDELRTLRWWTEIDTEAGQIGSFLLPRG